MRDTPLLKIVVGSVIGTLLVLAILAFIGVEAGLMPANADVKPGVFETWAAKTSLHTAIERGIKPLHDPIPATDSVMTAGVRLYGQHCVVCHGAADAKPSATAKGVYIDPPQFAKHDVSDDPVEETYWKITHGIRFTGMPSYAPSLTEAQRWAIASFLRHQDSLPPNALAAWKSLKSAADTT
ncbi:MAG TPA: cytochrome c [Gemmatimonadaceae bacterium]|nr:cytochrome c [Gemmatimonadaceae bacterium]